MSAADWTRPAAELDRRWLGGEAGHRSLLGSGRVNRERRMVLYGAGGIGLVLTMYLGATGLVLTVVLLVVAAAATARSRTGSRLDRVRSWRRWRQQCSSGTDVFIPVIRRPAGVLEAVSAGKPDAEQRRTFNAYRDNPDGAEGMTWLHARPGAPGIVWHYPTGEDAWLSVVFELDGAVAGLQSNDTLNARTRAFGRLQAQFGPGTALARRLQIITRLHPVDTAVYEAWAANEIDPDAPRELLESYAEVLSRLGTGGLRQRHYAVVRWPLTPDFLAAGRSYGPNQQGWLWLMREQIDLVWRQLADAGLGPSSALSAARVAAVLRHLQHPSWPVDQAGDVNPFDMWMPSRMQRTYVAVTDNDPEGRERTWLHRTAVVPIDSIDTASRDALWMLPMLVRMQEHVVRTISVQLEGVPQEVARKRASEDLSSDLADDISRQQAGKLDDGRLGVAAEASNARLRDLEPGRGTEGLGWAMHITVSAESVDALRASCAHMESAARRSGIDSLQWLDTQHAAAQACTWPLARGMRPNGAGGFLRGLLGGDNKGQEQPL
ncbi:hypothetical protein [Nocardioides sp. ChNu-99]|uniref:hypothetical protein n=1 Tax=Nocardioides sp. ChNu-99 TaxID=2839897 RepID=UPI0024074526|nr:hypothetical protein [Nocardioides sp. ChNu-99]MDF9716466.1 hypothetical protein [Nocardioides sp. ChNu-99]